MMGLKLTTVEVQDNNKRLSATMGHRKRSQHSGILT